MGLLRLEGILKEISNVETKIESETNKKNFGIQQYITTTLKISEKIKIKKNSSDFPEVKNHSIEFPGIIYPDSIGNNIIFTKKNIFGQSTCGSKMAIGMEYTLKDLKLNRNYNAIVHWESS